MKKSIFLILFCFFLIDLSLAQIELKTLKIDKNIRIRYSCYKSKEYEKNKLKMLVIALHWGWSNELPEYYSKNFLESFVLPIFDEHPVMVVAPDCPAASWIEEISVKSIIELRNYYVKEFDIDTNNVFLLGFSLGGIGTWYMGIHYPELFGCSIPIAGYPEKDWLNNLKGSRILAINSIDDKVIPFDKIEKAQLYLSNKENNVKFKILYGIGHYNTTLFINPVKKIINEFYDRE